MIRSVHFERFRDAIASLPPKIRYEKSDLLCSQFLLFRDKGLETYYIPFHRFNPHARVVLIGVTPGWTQMELAYRTAKRCLDESLPENVILDKVEIAGSFGGPMRRHLIRMLDGIALDSLLGVASCADFFGPASGLVQFTSAVTAPVFKSGSNYTGHNPFLLDVPLLRGFILENLAVEIASLPDAIVIPLGRVAGSVVRFLQEHGAVFGLCIEGFPHPSGANGHRKVLYKQGQVAWKRQLEAWRWR